MKERVPAHKRHDDLTKPPRISGSRCHDSAARLRAAMRVFAFAGRVVAQS